MPEPSTKPSIQATSVKNNNLSTVFDIDQATKGTKGPESENGKTVAPGGDPANYPWNDERSHVSNLRSGHVRESSAEKPKRIFQHPPEEYLPMLEEDGEEDDLEGLPTPPDGGWGWMVVFGSFMIHVFADGFTYAFGIFLPHLLRYFDVSKATGAWIVSILVGVTLGTAAAR